MDKITMFCFPYAGGSAVNYYKWKPYLNKNIELYPIELNGRGAKTNKPFSKNMAQIVEDIYEEIKNKLENNYILFGHSFGAWIAYELYFYIIKKNEKLPSTIFFSAHRPPYMEDSSGLTDNITDENLTKLINHYNNNLLNEDTEIFSYFMNILKADFEIISKYQFTKHDELISSDVVVLTGKQDRTIKSFELLGWRSSCGSSFRVCKVEGEHFFPFTNQIETVNLINGLINF